MPATRSQIDIKRNKQHEFSSIQWRNPLADPRNHEMFRGVEVGNTISVGRVERLDDGSVAFIPNTSPSALVALDHQQVQRRIVSELKKYMQTALED